MKLLVSPIDAKEAIAAAAGGADIVDVKNPKEGSLGANFPWVIAEVRRGLPKRVELSATIGDLDFKPGTASLAAYGVARLDVDYVKAGFYGITSEGQALEMGRALKKAISGTRSKLVIAGYADHGEVGAMDPFSLPEIARRVDACCVMMDTARKNGKSLLQCVSADAVEDFVTELRNSGLMSALAGSLGFKDIETLREIRPDIVGVRGLACSNGDRNRGRISAERVRAVKAIIR